MASEKRGSRLGMRIAEFRFSVASSIPTAASAKAFSFDDHGQVGGNSRGEDENGETT